MIVKIHFVGDGRKIIAVCDTKLLGKKFTQGNRQLDLNSDFYKGKEMTQEQIIKIIREGDILNLVGKETMEFAIKKNFISKERIIKIKNIPHAQAIL